MKTHIIDGEEYEECNIESFNSNFDMCIVTKDCHNIYLRKVKKKIEFPVKLFNGMVEINKDKSIRFVGKNNQDTIGYVKDLQKINEKMKELEEQGAFE